MAKLKPLVIERSRWLRGQGKGCLRVNEDNVGIFGNFNVGRMCCLGFLCEELGGNMAVIGAGATPPGSLIVTPLGSDDWQAFIAPNDDPCLDDFDREAILFPLFKDIGYAVEFVD